LFFFPFFHSYITQIIIIQYIIFITFIFTFKLLLLTGMFLPYHIVPYKFVVYKHPALGEMECLNQALKLINLGFFFNMHNVKTVLNVNCKV